MHALRLGRKNDPSGVCVKSLFSLDRWAHYLVLYRKLPVQWIKSSSWLGDVSLCVSEYFSFAMVIRPPGL